MQDNKDVRFFPIFFAATFGVVLEVIGVFVDEIVVGYLFSDDAFVSVNLIEPYIELDTFIAYLVSVGGAALIVRAHGAGDRKRMSEIFGQTIIMCAICGIGLSLLYVLFTPGLVRFVADDPAVYEDALAYFKAMRFYPLVDMFDTFLFTYVLYRGGYIQFYLAIITRIGLNAFLSWQLGLHMGMMGIGLASVISLLVAVLIKLTFLLTKGHALRFSRYFDLREAFVIAKLGFPESSLAMFIFLMELAINSFTLNTYAVAGVASVAVVVNVFEFIIYLSEGISEYEIVAVNDSIGKDSAQGMNRAIRVTKRAAVTEGIAFICLIFLAADILPEAFDIDNEETARLAAFMLRIFAPAALFVCLSRIVAIFYQYTKRLKRTVMLFGMTVTFMPVLFGVLFGQIAPEGIAAGMAVGPAAAVLFMYVFVRYTKKEKLFDYTLMHLK